MKRLRISIDSCFLGLLQRSVLIDQIILVLDQPSSLTAERGGEKKNAFDVASTISRLFKWIIRICWENRNSLSDQFPDE